MTSPAITPYEVRELVLATIERIWNGNDWSTASETYDENVVVHVPFQKQPIRGRDEFRAFHEALHTAFPDWHATIESAVAEGNTVAMRWTIRGTSLGPFMGFPPTGKSFVTTRRCSRASGRTAPAPSSGSSPTRPRSPANSA